MAPKTTKKTTSTSSVGKNISSLSTKAVQTAVGAKSDGIYGPQTTASVKAFQTANGLKADGIVGPLTQAAITKASGGGSSGGSSNISADGKALVPKVNAGSGSGTGSSSAIIKNQSNIVQTTSNLGVKDNKNGAKLDETMKLYTGQTAPTGVYGTPVKDNAGNVIGTEQFDANTGKPLANPNAKTEDVAGDIQTKDGGKYSMTAPEGFNYQLPTPANGGKYVYDKSGRAYLQDKTGAVTSDPTADAEYNKMKTANKDIADREAMYESYKVGLDEAHVALIDGIKQQAQMLKAKTEELNKRTLGLKKVMGYRTGSTEYTPEIGLGILKAEEQEGMARIDEIDANMRLAIAQATSARNEKNFALLEKRISTIDALKKAKEESVQTIYKNYADQVKNVNDQLKAIATEERAKKDQSIQEITTAAPALVMMFDSLKNDAEKKLWLEKMMAKTGLDASVIIGALEKSRLDVENKQSILDKRENPTERAASTKKQQDNDIAKVILGFRDVIKKNNWAGIDPTQYKQVADIIQNKYGAAAVLELEKAIKDAQLVIDDGSGI
jgi:peptidoglycan hydrolase-like protein with peptidoglycan-binding domain